MWVEAPGTAGDHLLDVDLVHEHVRWFDDPLTGGITVADRAAAGATVAGRPAC
jgi:hypothetical protein